MGISDEMFVKTEANVNIDLQLSLCTLSSINAAGVPLLEGIEILAREFPSAKWNELLAQKDFEIVITKDWKNRFAFNQIHLILHSTRQFSRIEPIKLSTWTSENVFQVYSWLTALQSASVNGVPDKILRYAEFLLVTAFSIKQGMALQESLDRAQIQTSAFLGSHFEEKRNDPVLMFGRETVDDHFVNSLRVILSHCGNAVPTIESYVKSLLQA